MSTNKDSISSNKGNGPDPKQAIKHLSNDLKSVSSPQQQTLADNHTSKAQTTISATKTSDNADSNQSTPNSSQQNSPTKSSPSKSAKKKRRNDAKKLNAKAKKQQQEMASSSIDNVTATVITRKNVPSHHDDGQQFLDLKLNPSEDTKNVRSTPKEHSTTRDMDGESNDNIECNSDRTLKDVTTKNDSEQKRSTDQVIAKATVDKNGSNSQSNTANVPNDKITVDANTWNKKLRENRDLIEQLKLRDAQLYNYSEKIKQQIIKIRDLEASLSGANKTSDRFEKLIQQEIANRTRLENENDILNQSISKLKSLVCSLEKDKTANSELIRTLNATLMERETEVSILKLKMTRLQTTQSSTANKASLTSDGTSNSASMNRQCDSARAYAASGRSNSEFSRNSYARSSMIAEAAVNQRSSTSQLQYMNERDVSIWAKVPEELTPSKRPQLLDRHLLAQTIYGDQILYSKSGVPISPLKSQQSSTPLSRDDRRYKTLPKSMKSPDMVTEIVPKSTDGTQPNTSNQTQPTMHCLVTNLDDSNNTSNSSEGNKAVKIIIDTNTEPKKTIVDDRADAPINRIDPSQSSTSKNSPVEAHGASNIEESMPPPLKTDFSPPILHARSPSSPVKVSSGLKRIFNVFRRSDSSSETGPQSKTDARFPLLDAPASPVSSPFKRDANRSTLVGLPGNARGISSRKQFTTDKPFEKWDTDMLVDWLTTIGLNMYANQCRRWVKSGAHIMNATQSEVYKGLGITNHLHRKKLRLAISELNDDCDKITKAAAKLDYLWVARWLDDIGLPQYKDVFITARIDGRVLNYLTVEDLFSLGIRSVLHHSSIKSGIKVLRSINFDLQNIRRRATAEEVEQMNIMRQRMDGTTTNNPDNDERMEIANSDIIAIPLWSCTRVMEWLRMIDFAEFAPNLRGSGIHGGLIIYEDGFNIDTLSSLLGIPASRTLLRRHLATFFDNLIGQELVQRKMRYKLVSSNESLDPKTNFKSPKKSPLWFKLKGSKVGQDEIDEYLCPMYPVEPSIIKSPTKRKADGSPNQRDKCSQLPRIPESINV